MMRNKIQHKKRRYFIFGFIIFIFGAGLYYTTMCKKNPFVMGEKRKIEEMTIKKDEKISVTILGAVKNGGTFSMKKGDTIKDVLHLAGGLIEQADKDRIYLEDAVFHEESIYVPFLGEKIESCIGYRNEVIQTNGTEKKQDCNGTVNINVADQKTLCFLPYIGEKKAQAIIEYRQAQGKFTSIEEVKEVDGIGEKIFEEIKIYLTIE